LKKVYLSGDGGLEEKKIKTSNLEEAEEGIDGTNRV
jgi:hypothetical protein